MALLSIYHIHHINDIYYWSKNFKLGEISKLGNVDLGARFGHAEILRENLGHLSYY